jgi:hypothetical protein
MHRSKKMSKILKKTINSEIALRTTYMERINKIPLPFEFYIDNKKYDQVYLGRESIDIVHNGKSFDIEKILGKEFVWKIDSIDYFKEYFVLDPLIINLNQIKAIN